MQVQYVIDAFADGAFTGNPAAVVPLEEWPDDSVLQAIATQNNLSETAYFIDRGEEIDLRWFTPAQEIDLCGHATLASAHAIYGEQGDQRESLSFLTRSGKLIVSRHDGAYLMDFPAVPPDDKPVSADIATVALESIGQEHGEVLVTAGYLFVVLEQAATVRSLEADMTAIERLPGGHILVSAPGDGEYDFVDRVFAPGVGIPEDPATGSAHCSFAPYWSKRLGKTELTAFQASARGGYFRCRWREADRRVDLIGSCRTFMRGEISL
ncbi:MAG: PhzF family phenazine biosynthesis protein [Thermoleophilaceae bacterium]|nr:PhzF family phenazine biosynthesis protein [Thermoleophilaceae bacterium]